MYVAYTIAYFLLFCVYCWAIKLSGKVVDEPEHTRELVLITSQSVQDVDEEPLTVINTVDGFVHGLDSSSQQKWKIDTGGPLAAAHHCVEDRPYWLIPETSGDILVHSKEGMSRSAVNTKMLVNRAPFMSEQDGLYFTGNRQSRVLGIDVRDGRVFHDTGLSSTERESLNSRSSDRKFMMWLGRVDYVLR